MAEGVEMKKPDRWERISRKMVGDFHNNYMELDDVDGEELAARIDKLLRQEHAWVRRMVKKLQKLNTETQFGFDAGWQQALDDVAGQIKERAK